LRNSSTYKAHIGPVEEKQVNFCQTAVFPCSSKTQCIGGFRQRQPIQLFCNLQNCMAYAKTTPAQVIAQLVIGASVGSLAWYSLRPAKSATFEDHSSDNNIKTDPVAALQAETRVTTGHLWGLPSKQDSSKPKLVASPRNSQS
jgi:hypothetical protein